jgi:hypothetical protein
MILTSQMPIAHWHEQIGDPTIADSILDRLVHNAYRIELAGESMRKKRGRTRRQGCGVKIRHRREKPRAAPLARRKPGHDRLTAFVRSDASGRTISLSKPNISEKKNARLTWPRPAIR